MPSDGLPKNLEPLAAGDPATIGPYVLSGKLGSGGMGTVYLGSLPDKNNQVAIKVIRPELAFDEQTRARFRDEMENARKVASFCTAKVLDHGTFENRPYMVTEYIAGTALAEHIAENGPLDSSTLHGFALGVAAALAAIHRTGLVHRDLKPANVLLSLSGPRVIDFGIARAMNTATNHTQTGIVMGSPGWMAPEQLLEEKVTTSADIFAWGCLVAFAGNGTHPFGSGDAMTLGKRVLFAEPQIGRLDSPLDRLVMRALAKEPNRRPTAQDLLLELAGGEDNTNDMVSNALHQSWRPNLPPGPPPPPPGGPRAATGMHPPGPGQYPRPGPPVPQPAHQTGNFQHPQQPPSAQQRPPQGGSSPVAPAAPQGQAHHPQGAPAAPPHAPHPASTGPIPMVQGDQQQGKRAGPQPYVPPVPPPPHQPAQPNRRRGLILVLTVGGAALLAALVFLAFFLTRNMVDSSEGPAGDPGEDSAPQEDPGVEAPLPGNGDQGFTSNDGLVEYHVHEVTCGMRELDTRVATLTNGEYCVVELEVTNHDTDPLHLDAPQQWLGDQTRLSEASEPSKEESVTSLWNGDGIAPDDSARGPLVFIIPDTHPREILMLTHKAPEETGEASERGEDFTEIPISEILEHSSTYEFDLET